VVGSANVDMVTYASRIPDRGETLVADRFELGTGGKGANQAVMAARLGAEVAFVGAVGADPFGAMLVEALEAEEIDVGRVARTEGVSSGVAPIWVEPDGANRILIVPGANDRIDPGVAASAVEGADRVDVVLGQLEVPQGVTTAAFRAARARRAITVLNPAPAAAVGAELLALSDWLIPNETEFAGLAGHLELHGGTRPDDAAVRRFQSTVRCGVVVTLGVDGAIAVPPGGGQALRVRAPAVSTVDTTGAGDAFVGAFAVGLAGAVDLETALTVACACASDSVTRPGTQSSFPSREDAARLAAAFWSRPPTGTA
jgi:ribokinase